MDAIEIEATVRKWIEIDEEDLRDKSFQPKMIWRDANEAPLLFMFPQMGLDRSNLCKAAAVLTAALPDAQTITFMADSWVAKPHPETGELTRMDGRPWARGSMEYAVTHKTADAHLIGECITYSVVDRDNTAAVVGVAYDRNDDGTLTFHWERTTVDIAQPDEDRGFIVDLMRDAMDAPKIESMIPSGADLDERGARIFIAAHAVKMVMEHTGYPCALAMRDEEDAEVLKKALGDDFRVERVAFTEE